MRKKPTHFRTVNEKLSGIYVIHNTKTDKKYVGQSVDLECRLHQHSKKLQNGKHENSHLQNAWDKYGQKHFIISVIEIVHPQCLTDRESFWINKFNTRDENFGYNICKPHNPYTGHARRIKLIQKRTK